MKTKIENLLSEIDLFDANSAEELENFRIRFFGKKGVLADLFEQFKLVDVAEKKEVGQLLNNVKNKAQSKFDDIKIRLDNSIVDDKEVADTTRPVHNFEVGHIHPLTQVRSEIIDIFSRIGFVVAEGPEIEDDWHNFSALNFPPEHPARDMQDTFFVKGNDENFVLRTHTSSTQIRVMEQQKPPIRAIFPGRVYRNEAISARAHCFFHQVEGLYIDKNVSFADLKDTLLYFAKELFGNNTKIRLRPSYFPFTEPSAEMDISCNLCGGEGCSFCKHTGWVEILGCGMVDPNVLKNCGIDPDVYSGFAFGLGIERITNLKFTINDLRLFSENDVRFLEQF